MMRSLLACYRQSVSISASALRMASLHAPLSWWAVARPSLPPKGSWGPSVAVHSQQWGPKGFAGLLKGSAVHPQFRQQWVSGRGHMLPPLQRLGPCSFTTPSSSRGMRPPSPEGDQQPPHPWQWQHQPLHQPPAAQPQAAAGGASTLPPSPPCPDTEALQRPWRTVVAACATAALLCYLTRANISTAIVPMAEQFSWDKATSANILSSFFGGYCLTQVLGGHLADRYGGSAVLAAGVALWSLCAALGPAAAEAGLVPMLATRFGLGVAQGVAFPAIHALLARHVPCSRHGAAIGIVMGAAYAGTVLAFGCCPSIIPTLGWEATFYLAGGSALLWLPQWVHMNRQTAAATAGAKAAAAEWTLDTRQQPQQRQQAKQQGPPGVDVAQLMHSIQQQQKHQQLRPHDVAGALPPNWLQPQQQVLWDGRVLRRRMPLPASAPETAGSKWHLGSSSSSSWQPSHLAAGWRAPGMAGAAGAAACHSSSSSSSQTGARDGGSSSSSGSAGVSLELESIDRQLERATHDQHLHFGPGSDHLTGSSHVAGHSSSEHQLPSSSSSSANSAAAAAAVGVWPLMRRKEVWAIAAAQYCGAWGFYGLLAWLPTFFLEHCGVSLSTLGGYTVGPYVLQALVGASAGLLADRLIVQQQWRVRDVRVLMQVLGMLGPAACMMAAATPAGATSPLLAAGLLTTGMGLSALTCSGVSASHLDIAPHHAGMVFALGNTASTLAGLLAVPALGYVVQHVGSWSLAFGLASAHNLLGALLWANWAGDRPLPEDGPCCPQSNAAAAATTGSSTVRHPGEASPGVSVAAAMAYQRPASTTQGMQQHLRQQQLAVPQHAGGEGCSEGNGWQWDDRSWRVRLV